MFKAIGDYLNVGDQAWAVRRRLVICLLTVCVGIILYTMYKESMNEARAEMLITQAFMCIMVIVNGYIFGVVVDDKGRPRRGAKQADPNGSQAPVSKGGDDADTQGTPPDDRPLGSK